MESYLQAKKNITLTLGNGTYINTKSISLTNKNTITIDGNGQTIDGNKRQLFYIGSETSLILKNITIINAKSTNGGVMGNQGTVTIINSTLANNTADKYGGVIANKYGRVIINNSILVNNTARRGGVIDNDGSTSIITQSTLANNTASNGGVIYNYGRLTIRDSTLANNTAKNEGGVISQDTIRDYTVSNSKFINNHAKSGAVINSPGGADLSGNIFINNTASNKETIDYLSDYFSGRFKDNVYESTDILLKNINLTVKDNKTLFHAGEDVVLNYSIGIEHSSYYDSDILDRLEDITIYINGAEYATTKYENYTLSGLKPGKYEVYIKTCNQKSNTVIFNVFAITNWEELSNAVSLLQNRTEDITLNLSEGNYINTGTIKWINPNIVLTIDGNGQTIDGNGLQVFNINGRSSMVLKNITIMNAKSMLGGAIYNDGRLTVIQSTLRNNSGDYGGAIENLGRLTVTQSTLTGNTAELGGAISNFGSLTITESILADNTASDFGGAIRNYQTLINIVKSNFTGNKAGNNGGAIFSYGNANLTDNIFTRNTARFNDTIFLEHRKGYAEGNVYESTDIRIKPLKLSIKDDQDTFTPYDEVVLNYTITLINPEYYDSDILERLDDIKIYVNGVEYDTTGYGNYTLTNLKPGDYTVYITTCNQKSNNVTFKIMEINDIKLTTWDVEMVQGRSVTLSAIVDYKNSTINQGQVYFEIDGEALSDENGSVLYAPVINNRADLPYDMPEDISLGNHTLTALYLYDDSILATDEKTLTIIENIPEGAGGRDTPSEEGKQGRNRHYTRPYETIHLTVTAVHEIIAGNTVIPADNVLTLGELGEIFNRTFTNGHLLVYVDGELVYNGTVGDDLTTVILQIIEKFLGKHEIKVEFTDSENQTKTYTENVTIS